MQFFAMTIYICVADTILFSFQFSVFTLTIMAVQIGQPLLLVLLLFVREVAALNVVDVVAYSLRDDCAKVGITS